MDDITAADRVTPLWGKLMRRTRARIAQAHLDLEKQLTPEQTEKVRGRLVELRAFERLDTDEPQFPQPAA
jgi:hypothetical protein